MDLAGEEAAPPWVAAVREGGTSAGNWSSVDGARVGRGCAVGGRENCMEGEGGGGTRGKRRGGLVMDTKVPGQFSQNCVGTSQYVLGEGEGRTSISI